MTRIAVITAGVSQPSSTRLLGDRLAAAVAGKVPAPTLVNIELRDHAQQLASNVVTGFPGTPLRAALDNVLTADALIAVTPIFSASYSGLFKMFFDVLEQDALTGKPVLMGATGGSARHSLALEHAIRPLFSYLHAIVVPTGVYAASADWGVTGLDDRIERAATELATLIAGSPLAPAVDPFAEPVPFTQLLHGPPA